MSFNIDLFERTPVIDLAAYFEKTIRKILPIYEKVDSRLLKSILNTKNAPELIKEFSVRYPNLNIGCRYCL